MSNATFSRKPLVAAVLTTLAVFSTGAMAADGEQEVRLTVGTGANTVPKHHQGRKDLGRRLGQDLQQGLHERLRQGHDQWPEQ